jgi:predicted transcriptional regulator
MAQPKPDQTSKLSQVLKLVDQLTPEEQQELLEQLKLEDLRREIRKGIEASERGEVYTEEEVLAHLDKVRQEIMERQKK